MFEDRLKRLRLARGLSQQKTAEALGLKVNTYRNYENNERDPDSTVLKRIGRYFGVTLDYLLDHHCDDSTKENEYNITNYLTDDEKQYINKYHTLDKDGKQSVTRILNLEYNRCIANNKKNDNIKLLKVARSSDGERPHMVELTKEQYDRLINAPETDEDL